MINIIKRTFSKNIRTKLSMYLPEENKIYTYIDKNAFNLYVISFTSIATYGGLILLKDINWIENVNNYFFNYILTINTLHHYFIKKENLYNFELFRKYLKNNKINDIENDEIKSIYRINYSINFILLFSSLLIHNYEYTFIILNLNNLCYFISDYYLRDYKFDPMNSVIMIFFYFFSLLLIFLYSFYRFHDITKIKMLTEYYENKRLNIESIYPDGNKNK